MDQLLHGGEVVAGVALMVGLVLLISLLRPPRGSLQARAIVDFPGAWIVVGLPLTMGFGSALALIAVGAGVLR